MRARLLASIKQYKERVHLSIHASLQMQKHTWGQSLQMTCSPTARNLLQPAKLWIMCGKNFMLAGVKYFGRADTNLRSPTLLYSLRRIKVLARSVITWSRCFGLSLQYLCPQIRSIGMRVPACENNNPLYSEIVSTNDKRLYGFRLVQRGNFVHSFCKHTWGQTESHSFPKIVSTRCVPGGWQLYL